MRDRLTPRWCARLALAAQTTAVLILLVFAGIRSVGLLVTGLAGLAVSAASLWWALTRRGIGRLLAITVAVLAPLGVLLLYIWADLLWVVQVSLVLWVLAAVLGGIALGKDAEPDDAAEMELRTAPPEHPFLIMNPRSGGGKVAKFHLKEKAEALGADVLMLDTTHPQDVVELASRAVADGADLLGVAGGDGTQALVAGVAAKHGIPFMVISAGTRNHFALDLGLDRDDPSTCLDALADGVELRIDTGLIGDRVFVNNASFGTYASVVQSPAYRDNKVRTTLEMLPDLLTHRRGPRLSVRTAHAAIDGPQAVLISNNPYRMGDVAGLGRRETLNSGVLGILGVKVDSGTQAAALLAGKHAAGLTTLTAEDVVIDADEPEIEVGVDGEALALPTPIRCTIQPRALRVRVPRDRPGVPPVKPPRDWRRLRKLALT